MRGAGTGGGRGATGPVAEIDLDALRANFAQAARLAGGRGVIAVVKADAYGHGAAPVARALAEAGARALATWSADEAASLRDAGIAAPLLVLGGVRGAEQAELALARELVPVLHDAAGRDALVAAVRRRGRGPARVQVELDTGMRRMGLPPETAVEFVAGVTEAPELELAGLMTHFARADEADLAPTREQLRALGRVLDALAERGVAPPSVHAANSAGLVALGELSGEGPAQDAVRPGLLLYGAQPCAGRPVPLRPVMSLRAPVVALRRVRRGDAVGYAARYRAPADTRIATLGIGYADGVPIAASGRGAVWLAGALRPFAGRVSMDSVGVEVAGDAALELGDVATFFGAGPDGAKPPSVDAAAAAADTLAYELLVRVGARVRRAYRGLGAAV